MLELGLRLERAHNRILAAIDNGSKGVKPKRWGLIEVLPNGREALTAEVIEEEGREAALFVQQVLGIAWGELWAMPSREFWHLYVKAHRIQAAKLKALEGKGKG
jgi:hypothetical protein